MKEKFHEKVCRRAPFGYGYHKIILDSSDNPIDFKVQEINKEFGNLTGLNKEQIVDKKITEVLPDIRKGFDWVSVFGEIALNGGEKEFEQYSESLDKYFRIKVFSPKKYYFVTIFTDITPEIELAKSSRQLLEHREGSIDYHSITDKLIDITGAKYIAFNKFDEDGKSFRTMAISGVNKNIKKAIDILGFNPEGKHWDPDPLRAEKIEGQMTTYFDKLRDLTTEVLPERAVIAIEKVFNIGQVAIVKITKNDVMLGDFTIMMPAGQQLKHEKLVEVYAQQVGLYLDRKKAEDVLKKSKKKYQTVFENTGTGTVIIEEDTTIALVNKKFEKLTGYSRDEIEGQKSWTEFVADKDLERMKKYHYERRKGGKNPPRKYIFQLIDSKDKIHDVMVVVDTIPDTDQSVASFLDITDRKKMEKKLKESEQKYRKLVETTGDIILIHDKDGFIKYANKTSLDFINHTLEELKNKHITQFLPEKEVDTVLDKKEKRLQKGYEGRFHYETVIINDNNKKIDVDVKSSPLFQEGEYVGELIIARDITERKKAEKEREELRKQVYQKQRLESIGTLAGGIAHDFNNILTVIQGHAQMLLRSMDQSNKIYDRIDKIYDSGKKAADLIQQLLLFSREEETEYKVVNINKVIKKAETILNRLIGENIVIHKNLSPNISTIKADKGQIEQIIINLAINSRDAMPEGGDFYINTKNIEIDTEIAKNKKDFSRGKYVCLQVEDTGHGMDEKTQEKIFDPFFTTKGRAEGTGMGLSVVHGIVKEHDGSINVESEPGEGTIFKIYFPISDQEEEKKDTSDQNSIRKYEGKGETVLVVEDEEDVLEYLCDIFRNNNYNCLCAKSYNEALKMFIQNKDEIDLVLSDIVMPDKDGVQLAELLRQKKNDLSIILNSGYSNQKINRREIQEKGYEFIKKPFENNELLKLVRKKLDSNSVK